MMQLIEQYQNQLDVVKRQIREMERNGTDVTDGRKCRQLKQMKKELQESIKQMQKYIKKG